MLEEVEENEQAALQSEVSVVKFDVLSVMKFSFLVSVGLGIAFVVFISFVWLFFNSLNVFYSFEEFANSVGSGLANDIVEYLYFSRVFAFSILIAVLNTIVLTVISMLYAFIYNVVSDLIGGIKITVVNE